MWMVILADNCTKSSSADRLHSVRLCNFDVSSTGLFRQNFLFQCSITFTDLDDLITERRSNFLQSLVSSLAVVELAYWSC